MVVGKKEVVFEDLYCDGRKIAAHADITDGDQSISIIEIGTTAVDKEEDWLYRITYSPKDKVSNSEEITVSFHRDYIQIGSEIYLAKQGVDYDDVLEWAKSKHEYLVKEYGAE